VSDAALPYRQDALGEGFSGPLAKNTTSSSYAADAVTAK
jgi:hypothetical protein